MKKIYKEPTIKAYSINHTTIMAASPEVKADPTLTSDQMDAKGSFLNFIGGDDDTEE